MGRAASATADPTLQRLHEVAERIRHRAAEGRAREGARPVPPPAPELPPLVPPAPPPRHWSDGPVDEADDVTHH